MYRLAPLTLFLFLFAAVLPAQRGIYSAYLSGTLFVNNGDQQYFDLDRVDFYHSHGGVDLSFNYRFPARGRLSFETGLRLGHRGFLTARKPAALSADPAIPNRTSFVQGGSVTTFSVPARLFVGKPSAIRTDRNQGSGFYLGTALQFNLRHRHDQNGLQYAIFRELNPRLLPYGMLGFRTKGGFLHWQVEWGMPFRRTHREFEDGGRTFSMWFREGYLSVGIGRAF